MEIVPFLLAKKLKEKGFKTENTSWCYLDEDLVQVKKYINISPYEYAPTISQVLKWLREEKKLFVKICYYEYGYYYEVIDIATACVKVVSTEYNSYELAALAGIKYYLDNFI